MKTIFRGAAFAVFLLLSSTSPSHAQALNACYVPSVGAIYLVGLTGLSTACIAPAHVSINLSAGSTLGAGAVATAHLADGAVTTAKIAAGTSVDRLGGIAASGFASSSHTHGSSGITDGAITSPKIALGAVGTVQIADNSLTSADIAAGAIGSGEIANAAVTRAKIASDAHLPQGMAAVAADGTLLRGLNVASVVRTGTGAYRVTFTSAVNVASGFYSVTPGLVGTCATESSAERSTSANAVFVLFASGSSFVNCAFSLIVF